MNKKERVDAALRGEKVDRVPASVWINDYEHQWDTNALMDALVENFTRYDWDLMNVHGRSIYFAEAWRARYKPSAEKTKEPIVESVPVTSASDWKRLRVLEPDRGPFAEQLRLLQLLNHQVGYDAYFVQTILCPLGVARYLVGNQAESVLHSIREDRSALHTGLRIITETLINYTIACLDQGVSGIFYTTNGWASESMLTQDQYREFGEQYDLEFLDAIKSRSKVNILHNCGEKIYFDLLASYPVQAFCWDVTAEGNPDLHDGQLRSGKMAMGGLSSKTLAGNSVNKVQDEVAHALEATGSLNLLLAPGNALPPDVPTRNLDAIRRALS